MAKFAKERRRGSLPPSPGKARQSYGAPPDSDADDIRNRVLSRLRKVGLGGGPLKDMRLPDSASSTPRARSPAKQLYAPAGNAVHVASDDLQGPMTTHLMGWRKWEQPGYKSPERRQTADGEKDGGGIQQVRIMCGAPQGLGASLPGSRQTGRPSHSVPTTPKTYRMASERAGQRQAKCPATDNPAARFMSRISNPEQSLWSGLAPDMKFKIDNMESTDPDDLQQEEIGGLHDVSGNSEDGTEPSEDISFQADGDQSSQQGKRTANRPDSLSFHPQGLRGGGDRLSTSEDDARSQEPKTRQILRLQAELTGAKAQISGLQEELESLKELDSARQAAMDRLVDHAAVQEQAVTELQESLNDRQDEMDAMRVTVRRAEYLAAHVCEMAAMVRPIRAELGLDTMNMPPADDLVTMPGEEVQAVFSEMLQEAEDCRAMLSNELSARDEVLQAVEAMQQKEKGLAQDLHDAGERESQLQQVAQALQDQLRAARGSIEKREEEVRQATEQRVMEREVTRMMEAHTTSIQSFKEASEAAEAAKKSQAAAEVRVQQLESLLQNERQNHQLEVEELRDETDSYKHDLEEARRALQDRQELLNQAEHRCHRLQQELQRTRLTMEQKIDQMQGQIHSLQEEAEDGVAEASRVIECEKKRAKEALEALNKLLPQVEGLNTNISAERARASSLSAALATTREMVKTLKQEALQQEGHVKQLEQKVRSAELRSQELTSKLSKAEHEAETGSFNINQEMDAARNVVEKLSSRITALEEELIQRRKDSKALKSAQDEIHRLTMQGKGSKLSSPALDDSKSRSSAQQVSVFAAVPSGQRPATPVHNWHSSEPKTPATVPSYKPFSQAAAIRPSLGPSEAPTSPKASRAAVQLKDMELSALVQQVKQLQSRMEAKRNSS